MRNISSKTDSVGDTLPASDFNANLRSEIQNVVTDAGFTLDSEGGPDTDLKMLSKAVVVNANAASYYQESGVADAYVLTRSSSLESMSAYIDGMTVLFKPGNSNTGASTVNISSIGVKSITLSGGAALPANVIQSNTYCMIRYNLASDRFELVKGILRNIEVFTTSGSYSKPENLVSAKVIVIGGGGGGGGIDAGSAGWTASGGGGGGGGASIKEYAASDLSASETVTIGAGGAGGVGAVQGATGGTSTFKSQTGVGGIGGAGSANTAAVSIGEGCAGGAATGGDLNIDGGGGANGFGYHPAAGGGGGGSSHMGGGASDTAASDGVTKTGNAGGDYGGGGSGASNSGAVAASDGGDGADGVIIIEELLSV